jgi:hypothetical protein
MAILVTFKESDAFEQSLISRWKFILKEHLLLSQNGLNFRALLTSFCCIILFISDIWALEKDFLHRPYIIRRLAGKCAGAAD